MKWYGHSRDIISKAFTMLMQRVWHRSLRTRLQKHANWKCERPSFCVRPASKNTLRSHENESFVWDIPQKVIVEHVRAMLSCETSLTEWKCKIWKQSFSARLPSKSDSWTCENEAFLRDFCQSVKVEDAKTKLMRGFSQKVLVEYVKVMLSCKTFLTQWKWKI